MIRTELTLRALDIARKAHERQTDKSGLPYILHPLHLAEQMPDEYTCCAALLHDTVEDTAVTLEYLEERFPKPVTDAVARLTRKDGVPYMDYVRALRDDPIASIVKLADLAHNSDLTRLTAAGVTPTQRDIERTERYLAAKRLLEEKDDPPA